MTQLPLKDMPGHGTAGLTNGKQGGDGTAVLAILLASLSVLLGVAGLLYVRGLGALLLAVSFACNVAGVILAIIVLAKRMPGRGTAIAALILSLFGDLPIAGAAAWVIFRGP